ncbi:hypothetical protein AB1Y20_013937 [Prymnesium parvum]
MHGDEAPVKPSEEAAKAAWLAKLDAPVWGRRTEGIETDVTSTPPVYEDETPVKPSEQEAKAAWLAKLDAPVWGRRTQGFENDMSSTPPVYAEEAPVKPSEEAAKAAWLAKLEAPVWGRRTQGNEIAASSTPPVYADEPAVKPSEEAAKAAWLAKLDAPVWGRRTERNENVVSSTPVNADEAPVKPSEEAAKAAWLSKLDAPVLGRRTQGIETDASSTPPAYADEPAVKPSEEEAKAAWLAKLDSLRRETRTIVDRRPASPDTRESGGISPLRQSESGDGDAVAVTQTSSSPQKTENGDEKASPSSDMDRVPATSPEEQAKAAWMARLHSARAPWRTGGSMNRRTSPDALDKAAGSRSQMRRAANNDVKAERDQSNIGSWQTSPAAAGRPSSTENDEPLAERSDASSASLPAPGESPTTTQTNGQRDLPASPMADKSNPSITMSLGKPERLAQSVWASQVEETERVIAQAKRVVAALLSEASAKEAKQAWLEKRAGGGSSAQAKPTFKTAELDNASDSNAGAIERVFLNGSEGKEARGR